MDPGIAMFAIVAGSTQLPKESTKKCNCSPGAINFCTKTHDFSTTMDSAPNPVTKKDFKSLTNVFASFNVGSTHKHERKKARTKAWRERFRVHKQARAEQKLARQQKKADRAVKRQEKLKLKHGDAYVEPSDLQRKESIAASSMDAEKILRLEEDDEKAGSVAQDVPREVVSTAAV